MFHYDLGSYTGLRVYDFGHIYMYREGGLSEPVFRFHESKKYSSPACIIMAFHSTLGFLGEPGRCSQPGEPTWHDTKGGPTSGEDFGYKVNIRKTVKNKLIWPERVA